MQFFKELFSYREMLFSLVRKDLRSRYKASVLGFLWTFLNPLLQLVVYTAVFSTIMRVNIDKYYLYMFLGIVPWLFLTTSLQCGATSIVSNSNLIKKVYFPRLIIPISVVSSAFINMLYTFIIVFLALIVSGVGFSIYILYLPVIMLLEYMFCLGLSFIFSALTVYFRDLEHIIGIVTMAWFYLNPIVYEINMVPEEYLGIFYLNPMTSIICAYRDVLYYQQLPQWNNLAGIWIWSILSILVGSVIFQILQKRFAEEL